MSTVQCSICVNCSSVSTIWTSILLMVCSLIRDWIVLFWWGLCWYIGLDENLDTTTLWHALRKKVSLIDSPEVRLITTIYLTKDVVSEMLSPYYICWNREPMVKLHSGKWWHHTGFLPYRLYPWIFDAKMFVAICQDISWEDMMQVCNVPLNQYILYRIEYWANFSFVEFFRILRLLYVLLTAPFIFLHRRILTIDLYV